MKKLFAILLVFVSLFVLVACGEEEKPAGEKDIFAKSEGVMTYAEYLAAEEKSVVVVETFIQAKQSWWEKDGVGVGTFYTMDKDGGYFIYNMPCSKDDYDNKLKEGAKIKVTGKKSAWAGEVEITDATWVLEEGTFQASAKELSAAVFNSNALDYQNQFFGLKGLTVEAFDAEGAAFGYKYNGSGEKGDDIYFKVKVGEETVTFVIESYLCDENSDVYKAAEALKVGDTIDIEGFMYWYNSAQPHVTKITVKAK